jgi:hypothetical protein
MGHGEDLLKYKSNKNKWNINSTNKNKWNINNKNIIPEGNTYATIAETGDTVAVSAMLNLNKISRVYPELLIDPIKNFDNLYDLIANTGEYHFKVAGSRYTNRYCDFLLSFPKEGNEWRVYRSGLYDIEQDIGPPLPTLLDEYFNIPSEGITLDIVQLIYNHSLFPKADDVIYEMKKIADVLEVDDIVLNNIPFPYAFLKKAVNILVNNITQTDLFNIFSGNHFNFSCRVYDSRKQISVEKQALARSESWLQSRRRGGNRKRKTLKKQ